MTLNEYYGPSFMAMQQTEAFLVELIAQYPQQELENLKSIVYCCSRIKSPESMNRKLDSRNLPQNGATALDQLYDAVGIRIVCAFTEDVYKIIAWLRSQEELQIDCEKDYISYPKSNGYRSYHLQIRLPQTGIPAEIQVRTIATDFWATLEHQLKYKQNIPHEELIRGELKRCADEIASVDLSMQTIRDIIRTSNIEESSKENRT